MTDYICEKKTFFKNKMWYPGDPYTAGGIPNKHFRKLKPGENEVQVEEGKEVNVQTELIRAALKKLDSKNDDHWLKGGQPSLAALEKIIGKKVSKKDVEKAWPSFNREMKPLSKVEKDFLD